jgi:hypothetical protein
MARFLIYISFCGLSALNEGQSFLRQQIPCEWSSAIFCRLRLEWSVFSLLFSILCEVSSFSSIVL